MARSLVAKQKIGRRRSYRPLLQRGRGVVVELTSREQGKSSTKIAGWEGKLSVPRRVTSLGTIVGPMLSVTHFCEFIVDHRR